MKIHRLLAIVLFVTTIFVACGSGTTADTNSASETVIYLTRHAEKADGKDPGLLPAGKQRAERLAKQLGDQKVAAIYSTNYNRTQQTGAPLARAAGVSVTTYPATDSPAKLTKQWLSKHQGKTILVVGHSNTIPALVNALVAGASYADIDEKDYDKLFRVSVDGEGKASVREMGSAQRQ